MTIFKDTVFLDIIGWTSGDGLIATDGNVQITGSLDMTDTITISSTGEATITLNSDSDANNSDTDVLVRFEIDASSFKGDVGYNQGNDVMQIRYAGATGININSSNQVGIGTTNPKAKLHVDGAISASSISLGVSGSDAGAGPQNRIVATTGSFQKLEKATGTFKIQHPDPSKSDKNLYHSFVESPTAGDNIYRFEIQAFSDNEQVTIDLPDYFRFLNEKPHIFVQAIGQFSSAYASADQHLKKLRVVCEKKGFYDVLLIATRKDRDAVQAWSGTERDK